MALHFLSVFFVLRSPPCHGAALFRPITLCFLSYSYFRHFGLNHYGPKPSWSVVPCGTRSASAEEMRMHSSEAAKVLGFPKSCARTKNLCKAPSLAGTFRTECVGVGSRATHVIRLVHMRAPVRHNAIDLCQPRGALCTRNRARARFGKPKTMWSLRSNEFGGQVQLQLTFCSTHINPWKQGILLGLPWEN